VKKILGDKLLQIGLGESQIGMKEKHENHDHPENQSTPPVEKKIKLYKPVGCDKCNNTGFKGRIGLYEVLKVNTEIKRLAEDNAPADKLHKQAVENGMITLVQDGYIKALWGITTIEEVLSVADE